MFKENYALNMEILSLEKKLHLLVCYLVSHISIGPGSVKYRRSKDENKIIILGCSAGEQAEHHHDKY